MAQVGISTVNNLVHIVAPNRGQGTRVCLIHVVIFERDPALPPSLGLKVNADAVLGFVLVGDLTCTHARVSPVHHLVGPEAPTLAPCKRLILRRDFRITLDPACVST